ncbi:helicase-related protein [Peribacillus saganii]|uniref:helicase-related protein n=1 Tax=Peribacillus saganii TaxID=2303992 RepID=UPI001F16E5D4|nr:helicase-related protein [Peribacillus saganii]
MKSLAAIYPEAVEQTKHKILDDIDRFLGNKESLPLLKHYLDERGEYIEQIWINVWLNKVSNSVPKKEKKEYLREKGFEVEGVDRKFINQIFRNEIRTYQPFDAIVWLNESFRVNEQKWKEHYHNAREHYFQRKQEQERAKKRENIRANIDRSVLEILEQNYELFYLFIRHYAAKQLVKDFKHNTKYKAIDTYRLEEMLEFDGNFEPADYSTVSQFFDELTGEIHQAVEWGRTFFEYETYYYRYQRILSEYIAKLSADKTIGTISEETLSDYKDALSGDLTASVILDWLEDSILAYTEDILTRLEEEFLSDLLAIADIPFDEAIHRKIYERDIAERERKIAEEKAAILRKQEEEARMLNDIFGREYSPSLRQNIHYVLHIGETNTGKTHQALTRMKAADSGLYLAPLRLLALEVYDKLNSEGVPCSLKTGEEEKITASAHHISCTVEMFHEKDFYEVVVIDEAQMLADKDRGFSWYKAISKANAREVHIIGSRNIKKMLLQLLGDSSIEVHDYSRDIPLQVESKEFSLKNTKKGDALVCFSRRQVLETASLLQRNRHSVSMIYGSMPPETRIKQMQRFINGETSVVVSTDAIGMGLNLPIARIVFLENEKFDGTRRRRLTSQEVKQIAGRAGRKGIYDIGRVAFMSDIRTMRRLLEQEDKPVDTFAIAPTNAVFERFQKYYRDIGTFFDLWERFESPKGTQKAALTEERELYELIRGTEIEARLSMMDLYGFLHLPFSKKEPALTVQWQNTMYAIVRGTELPEPVIKKRSLEEIELSYKSIGLHLLFLYRLDMRTEAAYWERLREELSDEVHEHLKSEVKNYQKTCRQCGKKLPFDHSFQICDSCHSTRYARRSRGRRDRH